MSTYNILAPWLLSSYPKRNRTEGKVEFSYKYQGYAGEIQNSIPEPGTVWAPDDNPAYIITSVSDYKVEDHDLGPNQDNPEQILMIVELTVTFQQEYVGEMTTAARLEKDVPGLTWTEVDVPLEAHPDFGVGGTFELTDTDWGHFYGWRNEVRPDYKAAFKYVPRDVNGYPVGPMVEIVGNCWLLCWLYRRGFESYVDYYPVWTITGLYRGAKPPAASSIGLRVNEGEDAGQPPAAANGVAGYPSGFEWRQNDDSYQNRGEGANKWTRSRRWQGASKVWYDSKFIFPTDEMWENILVDEYLE